MLMLRTPRAAFRVWLLTLTLAAAATFVPASGQPVLETLPANAQASSEIAALQTRAAANPRDATAAAALANAYYLAARRQGEPHYLKNARTALANWWDQQDAPTPILLARANILQGNHQFERALSDLSLAITREPGNVQAILVRATLRTVLGDTDAAQQDCASLQGMAQNPIVLACLASALSVTGEASQVKAAIAAALRNNPMLSPAIRANFASLSGEIAARLGEADAETHFKSALAADSGDLYTLFAYCDWLLDQGRASDVVPLIEGRQRSDGMLLRLALAQKALQSPLLAGTVAELTAHFAASHTHGDDVHRREEARFQLWLNDDPEAALALALANWQVQREPADLRILAEAAAAANDPQAKQIVRGHLLKSGLVYPAVSTLVQ